MRFNLTPSGSRISAATAKPPRPSFRDRRRNLRTVQIEQPSFGKLQRKQLLAAEQFGFSGLKLVFRERSRLFELRKLL